MTNAAPPGWYRHLTSPGQERWWDGTQYTQSRPVAEVPPPAPAAPAQAVAAYQAQPAVVYVAARPVGVSPKSRAVAAVLGFFLGGLGVDRFYLGNIGMGVAKLLLGWLTVGIWPFIDWIIILAGSAHDGEGLRVTEWS